MADKDAAETAPDSSQGADLTRPANVATILSYRLNRWILGVTALGVVVAVVVAFVSCGAPGESGGQSASISGDGNDVDQNSGAHNEASSGSCAQYGDNNTCVIELQEDVEKASEGASTDEQFKAELAKKSTDKPVEPGPWPYVVVDTVVDGVDYGLWARSTNEVTGDRVGLALNHSIVWADCVATSGYTPEEGTPNDVGPRWLRVRWKNDQVTERAMHSDPSDRKRAWMYLGYTVPMYHNGEIPAC